MGKLKVLPAQIANMIAAGEVVQRPASVIKELMENALDAGATKVNVFLADAGRTLVQVIDNGCGMSPSDAVLCFERHATSKIATPDDLAAIATFGFRGEALASIAAVSEVTLKTRRSEDETATQVVLADFGSIKTSFVSAPVGSNLAVRNLFYNTPARRKFLKSDNVELKHCVDEFTRIAITRPDLEFSLTHNGKDIYRLKAATSLKFRILDLLGSSVTGELVDIATDTSVVRLSGFVGRPESARKAQGNQFFFINGRYFRSPYLHKAVMKAYENLIPEGVTPAYFIFLSVDPASVDVNIHPTKSEIKFEDDSVIFQIVYAAVKETIGRNSFGAEIDFDTAGAVQMPQIGSSFAEYRGGSISVAPSPEFDTDYNPFDNEPGSAASSGRSYVPTGQYGEGSGQYGTGRFGMAENASPLFEGAEDQLQQVKSDPKLLIIKDKYILMPASSGLMAINIRRAQERLFFQRYLAALSVNEHVTQEALFPVQVQVGASQRLIFDENAELLSSLGFDITPFGTDTIVVSGVPEGYDCSAGKIEELVRDVQEILSEEKSSLREIMQNTLAQKFAAMSAAGALPITDLDMAQELVDALFSCPNPETTPGGKKIAVIVPADELDKKFQ